MDGTSSAIEVAQVSKTFGGRRRVQALRSVSLRVRPGEIYGLLGRNGAGKTTLVKILLDIVHPSGGRTQLLGRSSRTKEARRPVGYLPEDHRFPEYRTGEGVLHFHAMLSGLETAERKSRVPRLLEQVGLKEASRSKVKSYSKGMKQRLGLAQALVHDPKLVFLDEPTDGVDPVGRAHIRDLLLELKAEGRTIFINSHLLGEVEQICDRVAILEQGCLVKEGTVAELTATKGQYLLKTVPVPDEALLEALKPLTGGARLVEGRLEILLEAEEEVDGVVDFLRARGVSLRELRPRHQSLEEVFLAEMQTQEGGAA